jgi:hypothetical protein
MASSARRRRITRDIRIRLLSPARAGWRTGAQILRTWAAGERGDIGDGGRVLVEEQMADAGVDTDPAAASARPPTREDLHWLSV